MGDVELDETTAVINVPVEPTVVVRVDVATASGKKQLQRLSDKSDRNLSSLYITLGNGTRIRQAM